VGAAGAAEYAALDRLEAVLHDLDSAAFRFQARGAGHTISSN
jgi:hypothetical protein